MASTVSKKAEIPNSNQHWWVSKIDLFPSTLTVLARVLFCHLETSHYHKISFSNILLSVFHCYAIHLIKYLLSVLNVFMEVCEKVRRVERIYVTSHTIQYF